MRLRFFKKCVALSVIVSGMAVLAFTDSVEATSVAGHYGHPLPWNSSCFVETWGAATNTCPTVQYIHYNLPVNAAGGHNVEVTAYGASNVNTVGCAAFGLDETVSSYWGGSFIYLSTYGASQRFATPGAYVPSYGYLLVRCEVYPNGRVNVINYSE